MREPAAPGAIYALRIDALLRLHPGLVGVAADAACAVLVRTAAYSSPLLHPGGRAGPGVSPCQLRGKVAWTVS